MMNSMDKNKNKYERSITSLITAILLIIAVWSIISFSKNNDLIFPSVGKILSAAGNIISSRNFIKIMCFDLLRIMIAVMGSFIIALIITFIYIYKKSTFAFFKVYLGYFKAVPVVALSIFIWLIFPSSVAPVIITFAVAVPIVTYGLVAAIDRMDSVLLDDLKMLNISKFQTITKVYIPYLAPFVLMTFMQAFGLSFKVMITSEYICQTNSSIGKTLYNARSNLDMDELLAWSIIIVLAVVAVEALFKFINKRYLTS